MVASVEESAKKRTDILNKMMFMMAFAIGLLFSIAMSLSRIATLLEELKP